VKEWNCFAIGVYEKTIERDSRYGWCFKGALTEFKKFGKTYAFKGMLFSWILAASVKFSQNFSRLHFENTQHLFRKSTEIDYFVHFS
jgi:hypothetical protein